MNLSGSTKSNKVVVIAEAGVNHNGDIQIAEKLVEAAAEAGADYVKFQCFTADKLAIASLPQASYQRLNSPESSQLEMLKRLELSADHHVHLRKYAHEAGIGFMSTPFDNDALNFLMDLGVDYIKIGSGDMTNWFLLNAIGMADHPCILSTGMASLAEVEIAIDILRSSGLSDDKLVVMHATTQYPCPFEATNLRALQALIEAFGYTVGYSDHTSNFEVSLAAVGMGAKFIEKHFTLSQYLPGPDHKASLEPDDLKSMVKAIRNLELAMGDGQKFPQGVELENIAVSRKSLVASTCIATGDLFNEKNLTALRAGFGICPLKFVEIRGRTAKRTYQCGDVIDTSELVG